jgi:hypothetical protein
MTAMSERGNNATPPAPAIAPGGEGIDTAGFRVALQTELEKGTLLEVCIDGSLPQGANRRL